MENRKSREKKTDMLRSIGKQSGESVESVNQKSANTPNYGGLLLRGGGLGYC